MRCRPTPPPSSAFCDWLGRLYRTEMPHFVERNYDSPLDLIRPLGPAVDLVRLGAFGRLGRAVGAPLRATIACGGCSASRPCTPGWRPYEALALYAVITYMDVVNGVVRAGRRNARAPTGAGHRRRQGAVRPSATARRSSASCWRTGSTGPVRGVRLAGGEVIAADAVVCNPDLPVAYRTLLPGLPAPRVARRGRYSPSAVVWHAGVRGSLPPGAAHHNVHFGRPWDGAFRALIRDGRRMTEPSWLVSVPTVSDPALAPPGRHVLYALEPVPNLDGQIDWTTERARARDDLAAAVTAAGYPADVEVEELVDPPDMGGRVAWSGAHRSRWRTRSARPARSARPTSIDGLQGWCSPGRGPCPGSASRWCSCRACSPPQRVGEALP